MCLIGVDIGTNADKIIIYAFDGNIVAIEEKEAILISLKGSWAEEKCQSMVEKYM